MDGSARWRAFAFVAPLVLLGCGGPDAGPVSYETDGWRAALSCERRQLLADGKRGKLQGDPGARAADSSCCRPADSTQQVLKFALTYVSDERLAVADGMSAAAEDCKRALGRLTLAEPSAAAQSVVVGSQTVQLACSDGVVAVDGAKAGPASTLSAKCCEEAVVVVSDACRQAVTDHLRTADAWRGSLGGVLELPEPAQRKAGRARQAPPASAGPVQVAIRPGGVGEFATPVIAHAEAEVADAVEAAVHAEVDRQVHGAGARRVLAPPRQPVRPAEALREEAPSALVEQAGDGSAEALLAACAAGSLPEVERHAGLGASPRAARAGAASGLLPLGATCLHLAAKLNSVKLVQWLLFGPELPKQQRALVDDVAWTKKSSGTGKSGGDTALLIAAQAGHVHVVQALLEALDGADGPGGEPAFKRFPCLAHDQRLRGEFRAPALGQGDPQAPGAADARAAERPNEFALHPEKHDLDPCHVDWMGPQRKTALWWAARFGYEDIVKALRGRGANLFFAASKMQITVLSAAVQGGHLNVVKELVTPTLTSTSDPAMTARYSGAYSTEPGRAVPVDNGSPAYGKDDGGKTAFLHACELGFQNIAEFLHEPGGGISGADIKVKDVFDRSALFLAVAEGHLEIAQWLLFKQIGVATAFEADKLGRTPFMAAAAHCSLDTMEWLEKLASQDQRHDRLRVDHRDLAGMTAYLIAAAECTPVGRTRIDAAKAVTTLNLDIGMVGGLSKADATNRPRAQTDTAKDLEIMKWLIDTTHADPTVRATCLHGALSTQCHAGKPAIFYAAKYKSLDTFQWLVAPSARPVVGKTETWDPVAAGLVQAIKDANGVNDWCIRNAACMALATMPGAARPYVSLLMGLMQDPEPKVRFSAGSAVDAMKLLDAKEHAMKQKHAADVARKRADEKKRQAIEAVILANGVLVLFFGLVFFIVFRDKTLRDKLKAKVCPKRFRSAVEKDVDGWAKGQQEKRPAALARPSTCKPAVKVMSWNLRGASSNVFEFWGLAPAKILEAVEQYFATDAEPQVLVGDVLTPERLQALATKLQLVQWPAIPDDVVASLARTPLVAFLGDRALAKKKFVALAERGTSGRPAATTAFAGDAEEELDVSQWWLHWLDFFFAGEQPAWEHIKPHGKSHRAGLSDDELRCSQSLQLLYLAAFDGCILHLLNVVWPTWASTKRSLLAADRHQLIAQIVWDSYSEYDVLLLQDVPAKLKQLLQQRLPDWTLAGRGDVVAVRTKHKPVDETERLGAGGAVVSLELAGAPCVLASFHGDEPVPFLSAVSQFAKQRKCLFGVTAPLVDRAPGKAAGGITKPSKPVGDAPLTTEQFREAVAELGLHSSVPEDVWTTFKARTRLQSVPQKAVHSQRLALDAERGAKDHILARTASFFATSERDTTGRHRFVDAPLPTKEFPSDHAIVCAEVLL